MNSSRPHYGLVGNGRVAQHFRFYFQQEGLAFSQWSRSESVFPASRLRDCDVILVLIKDAAIEPMVRELKSLAGFERKTFVHFSGSLVTPLAESAHPLMTFGPDLYEPKAYEKIPFILEEGRASFAELFPELPNPSFAIPAAAKPYYHALCVMSGNFSTLLWQRFFEAMEARFGIPASASLPYMQRIFENLRENPASALTGPFARGDFETMRRNKAALASEGDPYEAVYDAFLQVRK